MQKLLIVGLGNPTPQYSKNRHNIGFMVLDVLASKLNIVFAQSKNLKSCVAIGKDAILCKPMTYMNASGEAVRLVRDYYGLEEFCVIHDELEIPFGDLRFKKGGGSCGHNGLKSIDAHCGNDYMRARCGIGRPQDKSQVAHYVLSDFETYPRDLIEACTQAMEVYIRQRDLGQLQNRFTLRNQGT